jgi:peptidoglycan/LPS O-acetylase OafA/YrhL
MPVCDGRIVYPALTGLRFPLALWVVAYHLSGRGQLLESIATECPALYGFLSQASVALGTFFMLSGFVLANGYGQTAWNSRNVRNYFTARFAKLYPLYAVSLCIVAPIIVRQACDPRWGTVGQRIGYVLNYGFLLQGWCTLPVHWNTPAWSLSCEFFYYLFFPAAVVLLRTRSRYRCLGFAAFGMLLPFALRAAHVPHAWKPFAYIGDFMVGISIGGIHRLFPAFRERGRGWLLSVPAAVAGLLLVWYSGYVQPWAFFDTLLRVTNAVLILGLALGGGPVCHWLSSTFAVWGGKASYAVYILHVPLLWWYQRTAVYGGWPRPVAAVAFVVGVVIISATISAGIERPANRILRKIGKSRPEAEETGEPPSQEPLRRSPEKVRRGSLDSHALSVRPQ